MSNQIIGNTEYKTIKDKAYINGTQDNIMQLAAELDKAGINYSGRVSDYRSAVTVEAADRAKALELMKGILGAEKEKALPENIIGNAEYRYIANKRYIKGETEIMLRVADRLTAENISFSGRINGDTATITVSGDEMQERVKKYFADEKSISENIQSAYFLALSSDTFEDGYYISEINTATGAEIAPYRSSIGDIPMFLSVDEAMKSAANEGITLSNSEAQLDNWRSEEAEKEKQSILVKSREMIGKLPKTDNEFDEYFVLREQAVDWIYFNPDGGDDSGQFVVTSLYEDDIRNAFEARINTENYEKFGQSAFIEVIENGRQVTVNADTPEFERYALSCINSRDKENVIVCSPVIPESGFNENFESVIERIENHFENVREHKEAAFKQQYVDLTNKIIDKQKDITDFTENGDLVSTAAEIEKLSAIVEKAAFAKTKLLEMDITADDVKALRSIQPARKSVQNMLENEVAQTPKFEKLLNEEMGAKSAFEMRNSDNEWRNDESKTVNVINIQEHLLPQKISDLRKSENISKISRGTFINNDTGIEIVFGRNAVGETIAKAIQDDKRNRYVEARVAALYQMQEIVENAICFDSEISDYDPVTSKNKSPNTLFMHKMYGVMNYKGEPYLADLTIEEMYSRNTVTHNLETTSNKVYSFKDIKITPMKPGLNPRDQTLNSIGGVSLGATITIPQLYDFVKTFDQDFFENPNAIGRADREAEIEAQNKFKAAMEIIAEKENTIENALNIKDNPILFSVVTLDGGDDIVAGGYIDDDNVRYMDEYTEAVSESNSDTVDVQVNFYVIGGSGNEAIEADENQTKYISEHLNEVLDKADLLESNRYSVEITDDEIENSDRNTPRKNLEFTVITFEDGSVYAEPGRIDDNNVKNTAAYAEMFKNNFDTDNIEDLDESIKVEYAVYRTGDGDVVMPTEEELAEIRNDLDNFIDGRDPVFEENSYLHPWQNDDDILYGMTEMWKKRHNDDPQISDKMDSDFDLLPKNLNPTSRSGGVGYYDTLSSVRQVKLSGKEWLDPFAAAVEMNRRGVDYNDIELVNAAVINSFGYYTEKDMTPEQFAVFDMRIDNDPSRYDELINSNRKRITEKEKGLAEAQNAIENNLPEVVQHTVASDELEEISEKIFTDDTDKKIEIAKQYLDGGAFSFDSVYVNVKKTDDNVLFSLDNGFEITYPWTDVAAAFEQAAINEMEWYYTSGHVLSLYNDYLKKDTAAGGGLGVQLDRATFTDWVTGIITGQNSVKTAYEANDKALFENTVRREVDSYFYMLCDKDKSIDGYDLKDISDFVNSFCNDENLRKETYMTVAENINISRGVMEKAKETARKAELPFSEKYADGIDEEFDPYAADGSMSMEDYELMHKNMREDSFEIYQIKNGEEYHGKRFAGLSELNGAPNIADYELVYSGQLSVLDITGESTNAILENIYTRFNIDRPQDFTGRSLSVSDVVVLHKNDSETAHYVDTAGFKDVPEFLKEKLPTITLQPHILSEGELVTFPDRPGVWKVSAVTDMKIDFENTDQSSADRIFSNIDFGQNRENLQEKLNYTVVSQDSAEREKSNTPAVTSGTIEKYGLDIDFKNINSIVLRTSTEEYIGGIDSNGHERRDNYTLSETDVEFYFSEHNGAVIRFDNNYPIGDMPVTIEEALEEIQNFLDEALNDSDKNVIMSYEDGRDEYIYPEKLLEEKEKNEFNALLDEAKHYISSFCDSEYGSTPDFGDLKNVNIAYTTLTDDELPVQVTADLIDYRIIYEFDGEIFNEEQYNSLEEMNKQALSGLDFDELVSVPEDILEKHSRTEPEGFEPVMKRVTNPYNSYLIVQDVRYALEELYNGTAADGLAHGGYDWQDYYESFSDVLTANVHSDISLPLYKSNAKEILSSAISGNADLYSDSDLEKALASLDIVLNNAHLLENIEDNSEQLSMFDSTPKRKSSDEIVSYYSSVKDAPQMEETSPAGTSANDKRKASELAVGDRFIFQGEEVTVTSFKGIYPDDIGVSKFKRSGGTDYEVTSNVNKYDLVNYGKYLGNNEEKNVPEKSAAPADNIPKQEKAEKKKGVDYSISEENYGNFGGAKKRFENNIAAIKCLKNIESEKRNANSEEQEILAKYVGWGGIPEAFDSKKTDWKKEYEELKSLLTDEEYRAARASTMNAHYTTPTVISAVYSALSNMGFKGGKILEPAMGIGNFFGVMPENVRNNSELYGVELDSITGRIAKQLYPSADVQIKGYEKTVIENDSFDVAIGNVPFGGYKLSDGEYDKHNFLIHDYFFAKTLDKVRPGGIVAFVTSKGTLDKANPDVRKYLAERAELLGAIRLPGGKDGAFFENAGTEVTSDIIFLQKRERPISIDENTPEWVNRDMLPNGIAVNGYFASHPEMILGEMVEGNKLYGSQTDSSMCLPIEGADLKDQLREAVKNIQGTYKEAEKKTTDRVKAEPMNIIPCPPGTPKYSYVIADDVLYYHRSDDHMERVNAPEKNITRIKAMTELRDSVHRLLDLQLENTGGKYEYEITSAQERLSKQYDEFSEKYGLISSAENKKLFREDNGYHLIKSLERLDKDGNFEGKADIFYKKTVSPKIIVDHCDNANDALILSLSEKCSVDLGYMSILTGKTEEELISELGNKIFQNPQKEMRWESADEYLTGNVRQKLAAAEALGLERNAEALRAVIPEKINAADISARLGSAWIDPDYIRQFIVETIRPDYITSKKIEVKYSEAADKWKVEGWRNAYANTLATETYGTQDMSAYEIIEATLNMKKAEIRERVRNEYGNFVRDQNDRYVYVVNQEKTMVVQAKQDELKRKFSEWIFADPERREKLETVYNEKFNSVRLREYDGTHLNFVGMNASIELKPHQKNAVARDLYSEGNTLLAHEVGAGKTYEIIAIAMEGKRLGLHSKSLIAAPNALTEQWGDSFRTLYPNANVLVATEKDFKKENRRDLFAKIATGDWDAVIIGHSQLDMIHLSKDRELDMLYSELDKLQEALEDMTSGGGGRSFSVKQIEKSIKAYESKVEKLLSKTPEDDMLSFEQLGIDKLFIDESQNYKNLDTPTKMQNVSGIGSGGSGKSMQLLMKCKYLDEITGGKGTVFASGTPISNSMSEMYTLMRYLQADKLSEMGIHSFDQWASVFGETTISMELSPEGNGKYQMKTRFSKFQNLPELMNAFKECADIKTADSLNLDRPDYEMHNVNVPATAIQLEMIKDLGERARDIRAGTVQPTEDNMCKLTVDGRKIGLDQRCIDPSLPDDPNSKVNVCINNVFDIWQRTADKRSTQLIFSDLATPQAALNENTFTVYRNGANIYEGKLSEKDTAEKISEKLGSKPPKDYTYGSISEGDIIMLRRVDYSAETAHNTAFEMRDGKLTEISPEKWSEIKHSPEEFFQSERKFCVYDDIKKKLIEKGIPESEIAFIHDFDKAEDKQKLFDRMNKGDVRVLIGSTLKCGAGMNAQQRMIALHDLDAPMRPSDMSQRHGRIIRQGNMNPKVDIYRYTTDRTFDSYIYQMLENKQKFISQIMTDRSPVRSCEDVDEVALDYAEVKALCAGNPLIREKIDLETAITKLNVLKSSFLSQKYSVQDKAYKTLPQQKAYTENYTRKLQSDIDRVQSVKPLENEDGKKYYPVKVGDKEYHDKEKAGEAIREAIRSNKDIYAGKERYIGSYRGFEMYAFADSLGMYGERVAMKINLKGACDHYGELNMNSDVNAGGNIIRLDNIINGIELEKQKQEERLANLCADIEEAKAAAEAVFPHEQELSEKEQRLAEVNTLLSQSDISDEGDEAERSGEAIDYDEPEEDREEEKVTSGWER